MRYLPNQQSSSTLWLRVLPQLRRFHIRKVGGLIHEEQSPTRKVERGRQKAESKLLPKESITPHSNSQKLSLLEELFPEEIHKPKNIETEVESEDVQVPRLPLAEFDEDENAIDQRGPTQGHTQRDDLSREASKEALRKWNLATLVIRRASNSLDESDFRRIVPKGQHIQDWNGPGDFIKVIPGRDRSTLQQSGHYFLLFPNPAYARAFQGHVISLHRIARTHTPTSIESPIRPPPGMLMDGEDVYGILQSYALCPPSQKISLKVLFPPYSSSMKKLLNQRGYNQIVSPDDKTGRSVLVWVEGYQPTLYGIQSMIHADGRNRGLAWGLANSQKPIVKVNESNIQTSESDGAGSLRDEDELQRQRLYPRYIASFVDENEARRFIRAWHRRPFPLQGENVAIGEPLPLVHAELLW